MGLFDSIFNRIKGKDEQTIEEDPYEYCPRCNATLTLQKGYDNTLPYWICLGCREMLINPELDTDTNIIWRCDSCGALLNMQDGFDEECGEWACRECGYTNVIDASEVYASEDELQMDLSDPYKGMTDEDVLALSCYQDEDCLAGRNDILLVSDRETGKLFVKKMLTTYDKSIYDYLKSNPVKNMPRIVETFEGRNCLIVIEEYIKGNTVAKMLEERLFETKEAATLVKGVCVVLDELHNRPKAIIHRDVKPSNIIVGENGQIYLLDMNVAKWFNPDQTDDTHYMGTQNYAAPEQVGFGLAASSAKSDIYAVGVLLNVMMTGEYPKEKRASGKAWDIIERCISLEADKRYTAKGLIEELDSLIGGNESAGETNK